MICKSRSFKRVIENLQANDLLIDGRKKKKRPSLGDGDATKIKQCFENNPKASGRKVRLDLKKESLFYTKKMKKR